MQQGNTASAGHALQGVTQLPASGTSASPRHNTEQPLHSAGVGLSSCVAQHARALLLQARLTDPQGCHTLSPDAVTIAGSHAACMRQRRLSHASASTSALEGETPCQARTRGRRARPVRGTRQLPAEATSCAASSQSPPRTDPGAVLHKQLSCLLQAYERSHGMPLLHR